MKRFGIFLLAFLSIGVADAHAQRARLISDIQGNKNYSAYEREWLRTSGIVTARTRNGFFIQTPDDKVDNDPNTSEALFVFTRNEPPADAAVGNFVTVAGNISEFSPAADPGSLPITQMSMQFGRDLVAVESRGNPLPKPILLTLDDFRPRSIDQLEKYENMRIAVDVMTVVAPTGARNNEAAGTVSSDGVFYGVLKGFPRPFREIGFSLSDLFTLAPKDRDKLRKDFPDMVLFDHNPERLRVETANLQGARPIDVTVGNEVKGLVGILYYSFRAYSVLVEPDNKPSISGANRATPVPAPGDGEFMIAGMNIERLFDETDERDSFDPALPAESIDVKFRKVSNAVRNYLRMPDVLGLVEVENLPILERLAAKINADAVAAGLPDPGYKAHLIEGNDPGGIDNAFLVKGSTVKVIEVKQFGKGDLYRNPVEKKDMVLNDRPPLMLRASVRNPKTGGDFEFTVIVNHMKSLRGYNDEKEAPAVRLKKQLQAEILAKLVDARQKANPNEAIALIGDFNHFEFNDGITDILNTVKGTPAPKGSVMFPSDDFVATDLINIIDRIEPAQRYTYTFDGNAQVLDHFVVNQVFFKYLMDFKVARLNADFPGILKREPTRVERFSDHDVPVGYFGFE